MQVAIKRDHHEHQQRQGVDVVADRELQPAALVERVPVARIGDRQWIAMPGMAASP